MIWLFRLCPISKNGRTFVAVSPNDACMVLQRRLNVCVYYATPCAILCEVLSEQCEVLFYGVMGTLYVYYRLTCERIAFSSQLMKISCFDCQLTFLKMTKPYSCTNWESSDYIIDRMSCYIVCSYLE